jgi:DNA helicase II / ATP-dependent DNA helicase PcrA
MLLNNNFFIHAVAGSGKTTRLVKLALREKNKKILITTYTRHNTEEIKRKIIEKNGYIPSNIEVFSWYGFLLSHCIRPYQNILGFNKRISELFFTPNDPHIAKDSNGKIYVKTSKEETLKYYTNSTGKIYSCKLSEFACACDEKSSGKIIKRLESCYDYIFIDEAQDFSGYDFDFVDLLLSSRIKLIIVGDSRQNTFDTHKSRKNKKYSDDIDLWFKEKIKKKKGILKYMNKSWRCNQDICNFADKLYPDLPKSSSLNLTISEHRGVYYVKNSQFENYVNNYSPTILVYDKNVKKKINLDIKTINFGVSKGSTYDRVLIKPTETIKKYLKTGSIGNSLDARNKLYVAITRAKNSVAFLVEDNEDISLFHFEEIEEWSL